MTRPSCSARTDIQFVRDLARKNGLEFYFETDDTGTMQRLLSRAATQRHAAAGPGHPVWRPEQLKKFLGTLERSEAART